MFVWLNVLFFIEHEKQRIINKKKNGWASLKPIHYRFFVYVCARRQKNDLHLNSSLFASSTRTRKKNVLCPSWLNVYSCASCSSLIRVIWCAELHIACAVQRTLLLSHRHFFIFSVHFLNLFFIFNVHTLNSVFFLKKKFIQTNYFKKTY